MRKLFRQIETALAITLLPAMLSAQALQTERRQFLDFAIALIVADLRSGKFGSYTTGDRALPWRVDGPNIDSTSNVEFERAILDAVGGRRATANDSMTMTFDGSVNVSSAKAELKVSHGSIWCVRGQPLSSGTYYSYTFARKQNKWEFVARTPVLFWDPPPIPSDSVPGDRCARAIARDQHAASAEQRHHEE